MRRARRSLHVFRIEMLGGTSLCSRATRDESLGRLQRQRKNRPAPSAVQPNDEHTKLRAAPWSGRRGRARWKVRTGSRCVGPFFKLISGKRPVGPLPRNGHSSGVRPTAITDRRNRRKRPSVCGTAMLGPRPQTFPVEQDSCTVKLRALNTYDHTGNEWSI